MDHPSPPFCTTNYQNMVKSNLCCYYFCFQVFFQKYAFLKVKDFGMSQYSETSSSETLCAMCYNLNHKFMWLRLHFSGFWIHHRRQACEKCKWKCHAFLSSGWTKGPRKWNKLFTWHIDRRGPLGLLTDNVRKCHQHIVSYYYCKIIKYVTV